MVTAATPLFQATTSSSAAPTFAITPAAQLDFNTSDVVILTPEDFLSVLQDRSNAMDIGARNQLRLFLKGSVFGMYWNTTVYPNLNQPAVLPAGQAAADIYTITNAFRALGIAGTKAYTAIDKKSGRLVYILKGYPGLRNKLLQGTRFLANSPQILSLGLGMKGVQSVAKGGFILGLVVTAGIEVIDFIFNDQKTLYDLVGNVGYEVAKSGIVMGIGLGAGAIAGTLTTIAVAPLIGMVAVTVIFGMGLNMLDDNYKIKQQVLDTLKKLPDNLQQGIYQIPQGGLDSLVNSLKK
jgi:hypothetical protein